MKLATHRIPSTVAALLRIASVAWADPRLDALMPDLKEMPWPGWVKPGARYRGVGARNLHGDLRPGILVDYEEDLPHATTADGEFDGTLLLRGNEAERAPRSAAVAHPRHDTRHA